MATPPLSLEELDFRLREVEKAQDKLRTSVRNPSQTQPGFSLNRDLHDLGHVPAAVVFHLGSQSVATGTPTTLTFDDSNFANDPGLVDLANDKFNPRVSGLYLVTATVEWAANATGYRVLRIYAGDPGGGQMIGSDVRTAVTGGVVTGQCVTAFYEVERTLGTSQACHIRIEQSSGGNLDCSFKFVYIVKVCDRSLVTIV